jgi:hypothetical protein
MEQTPAKRALAALDAPSTEAAEKPKRISNKIKAAINAMVAGEAKTDVAAFTARLFAGDDALATSRSVC